MRAVVASALVAIVGAQLQASPYTLPARNIVTGGNLYGNLGVRGAGGNFYGNLGARAVSVQPTRVVRAAPEVAPPAEKKPAPVPFTGNFGGMYNPQLALAILTKRPGNIGKNYRMKRKEQDELTLLTAMIGLKQNSKTASRMLPYFINKMKSAKKEKNHHEELSRLLAFGGIADGEVKVGAGVDPFLLDQLKDNDRDVKKQKSGADINHRLALIAAARGLGGQPFFETNPMQLYELLHKTTARQGQLVNLMTLSGVGGNPIFNGNDPLPKMLGAMGY